jgi:hypothetical protein
MPGLVPGIHVLKWCCKKVVDGRVKPGHDDQTNSSTAKNFGETS